MKTMDFKEQFISARQEVKNRVHRIMLARMVLDNVSEYISEVWKVRLRNYGTAISVTPIDGLDIKPDLFDKMMERFAKKTNCEPDKFIDKDYIEYSFTYYPSFMKNRDWSGSVAIEFKIGNSEVCDVEVVNELRPVTKLTGYCKALAEKMYLERSKI